MADGAAAELEDDVLAQVEEQLVHLAGVDAARRDRHDTRHRRPVQLPGRAPGPRTGLAEQPDDVLARRGDRGQADSAPLGVGRASEELDPTAMVMLQHLGTVVGGGDPFTLRERSRRQGDTGGGGS